MNHVDWKNVLSVLFLQTFIQENIGFLIECIIWCELNAGHLNF